MAAKFCASGKPLTEQDHDHDLEPHVCQEPLHLVLDCQEALAEPQRPASSSNSPLKYALANRARKPQNIEVLLPNINILIVVGT